MGREPTAGANSALRRPKGKLAGCGPVPGHPGDVEGSGVLPDLEGAFGAVSGVPEHQPAVGLKGRSGEQLL